jgi:hypothetical protein
MPYIRQVERNVIDPHISEIIKHTIHAGQLNYTITKLLHSFLRSTGVKYARLNEVIGVLECVKLELYSQVARPYEDKKKKESGAISELDSISLEDVR